MLATCQLWNKAMKINLEGGYIEVIGTWTNVIGEKRPMYRAVTSHTNEAIECFSKGLAEFWVWINHERYESMRMRGVRS